MWRRTDFANEAVDAIPERRRVGRRLVVVAAAMNRDERFRHGERVEERLSETKRNDVVSISVDDERWFAGAVQRRRCREAVTGKQRQKAEHRISSRDRSRVGKS